MNAAVEHADTAADAWSKASRAQLVAAPDHADFYDLMGDIAGTLHALQDVATVLRGQVAGYGEGRPVYDDTRIVDPALRLAAVAEGLAELRALLDPAGRVARQTWALMSHIGVEVAG